MGIFDLIRMLRDHDVDYVLVGGLAVALHGHVRATLDVDVVLAMDPANLERFIAGARASGLQPTIPVPLEALAQPELIEQWHREKGMLAFSMRGVDAQATVIDVLVRPCVAYADLKRDAIAVRVGSCTVPVASVEHLIQMKSATGRAKDALDVEALKALGRGDSA